MAVLVNCAAATPVYYSENEHYYDIASSYGITWKDAKTIAESMSYNGMNGHLVTITSQNENNFIVTTFNYPSHCWLGGFQPDDIPVSLEPDGGWQWVTGEPWGYTNWADQQPDNSGGEHYLHFLFWSPDHWNDLPNDPPNDYKMYGFIVEYEPTTTSVPEFPSIVLPVAAILGLIVVFGRRKI